MRLLTCLVLQDLDRAVAVLAHEHRDRHAPGALARDHPVGPALDHAGDAVLALRRDPFGFRDRGRARDGAGYRPSSRCRAGLPGMSLVHRDEPLRRVAEDHRLLRAPRMRILVLQPPARDQRVGGGQRLDHRLVGVALLALVGEHALAGEARRVIGERAVLIDRVGDRAVDAARLELARGCRSTRRSPRGRGRARCARSRCRHRPTHDRPRAAAR